MRRTFAAFWLAVMIVGSDPDAALAQIGYTPSSIEWLTASSDVAARLADRSL